MPQHTDSYFKNSMVSLVNPAVAAGILHGFSEEKKNKSSFAAIARTRLRDGPFPGLLKAF